MEPTEKIVLLNRIKGIVLHIYTKWNFKDLLSSGSQFMHIIKLREMED